MAHFPKASERGCGNTASGSGSGGECTRILNFYRTCTRAFACTAANHRKTGSATPCVRTPGSSGRVQAVDSKLRWNWRGLSQSGCSPPGYARTAYNTGYSSPGTRVKTHVICNHADTKEVRSGVTYRNLSITDTSFINWIFPQAEGFDVLHTFIPRWGMCVVDAGAL
jgi:hypothetical protein